MRVKHYYIEKIAHSSYIVAGDKSCAVVDPSRDVDLYIRESESLGLKITHILETHLHADFISGHLELAKRTGADIYMPASAKAEFDHVGIAEGTEFYLEDMKFQVLETPGHTPEHISYVVTDTATSDEPVAAFVGDTLFVGDAGRPDLFPNRADELARKLYNSLFEKLMKLPDFCEVYPAHGAGSLCGKAMGAKYTTTIGYERKYNPVLQEKDVDKFIKMLTEDMPGAPDHFSRGSKLNAMGPKSLSELAPLQRMDPKEFSEAMAREDTIVVDVRGYFAFGGLHIPDSYCLDHTGNLPTFAGWVLPPDKNILLVAETPDIAKEAALWLYRVGLDNVMGFLEGGMHAWAASGSPVSKVEQISPKEYETFKDDPNLVLVDARDRLAYEEKHIDGAINIPAPDLRTRHQELSKDKATLVICNSGVRSSLGISILKQNGFDKVLNFAGSMKGYQAYHGK
ncbi:MBL fold metallo-hydrolase [Alkalibacter rhizosphaerae]|uniref:MBL fold metallo-hydrolase n=1 Tax=Alkalibacter rhizosphaerae TaxID=2815577 RepID=A0A975AHV5_9FIRM|nr:rhodanese-like domain-containing protein [Alkalibacter rhizosphaerae]QSX07885.1 MBL fold metallo-hydrolase [Alkalibacter rhizosphaerae]